MKNHHGYRTNFPKSVKSQTRKKELLRIIMENQAILKRLQGTKSTYNVGKWEEDHIK
jgi:hypothetical protein